MILKEMLRHESLCKLLLWSDQYVRPCPSTHDSPVCRFYSFPHYIEERTFGISCDAFANYKARLLHPPRLLAYLYLPPIGNVDKTQTHGGRVPGEEL